MSEPASDHSTPAKRRAGVILLFLAIAAVIGIAVEPTGVIRGRLVGEPIFLSRPASYWEHRLLAGPAERSLARQALVEAGPDGVPVLVEILQSSDEAEARWTAAEILGELGPDASDASAALLNALDDPDPYVQSVAVQVIPEVGTPAGEAVPALAGLLDGEHAVEAARAISVYRSQATPALSKLVSVLTDPSRSTEARWNAARTIGKTGPPAIDTLPILVEMTRDSEATVRGNAAEAIGDIGPTAAAGVPALIEVLDDPSARVRHHAVRSLGYIGPAAVEAVPEIRKLLEDADSSVQSEARKALHAIAPELPSRGNDPVELGTPE